MDSLLERVRAINRAMSRTQGLYREWLRKKGLNGYYLNTLYALFMEPELSQKEISEDYGIPRQTVNNAIKRLEAGGFAVLERENDDGRRRKIRLTRSGEEYLKRELAPILELESGIVEKMGQKDCETMTRMLEEYAEELEKEVLVAARSAPVQNS